MLNSRWAATSFPAFAVLDTIENIRQENTPPERCLITSLDWDPSPMWARSVGEEDVDVDVGEDVEI